MTVWYAVGEGSIPSMGSNTMGYFRRYKLSDYTADDCHKRMNRCVASIMLMGDEFDYDKVIATLEEWACFRELLARHEKNNQSPIDKARLV